MKILYFGGGLGNQIFEYAFYLSVKDRFPKEKVYGVFDEKRFKEHAGGFEIEKIFNVNLPRTSFVAKSVMKMIMAWNKLIHPTAKYCHNLTSPNYHAVLFNAFKMNKEFYKGRKGWISYKPLCLDGRNKEIIYDMLSSNSVSLHVRRGDFLSSKYAANHVGIATDKYYADAIRYICEKMDNPKFFVFSDDIPWCKSNLNIHDAVFVDWNTGEDSYIDMYLMKHTKANIIANSTFSYWGAYFNANHPLVIYPKKWKYSESEEALDIFPDNWIGMESE